MQRKIRVRGLSNKSVNSFLNFQNVILELSCLNTKKNRENKTWLFFAIVICRKLSKIRLSKKFRKSEISILYEIPSSSA